MKFFPSVLFILLTIFSSVCSAEDDFAVRAVRTILKSSDEKIIEIEHCNANYVKHIFEEEVQLASDIKRCETIVNDVRERVYIYKLKTSAFFFNTSYIRITDFLGHPAYIYRGNISKDEIKNAKRIANMSAIEYKARKEKQQKEADAFLNELLKDKQKH